MNRFLALSSALLALCIAGTSPVLAQAWPRQPIKIIVTFPPGGAADMLTRAIGAKMAENMGQSVVIENRPGAAGNVGITAVARAPADGYTLGVGTLSTLAINPALSQSLPFDARKDFIPIAKMTELPIVLATPMELPATDLAGLIDYARKNPDKMNYSTNGPGSSGHLVGELINRKFGIKSAHVPYGGDAPILNALMGQHIQLGILSAPAATEFMRSGKVRILAVTSPQRLPTLQDVPTLAELGHGDLSASTWFCIVAPAGTWDAIFSGDDEVTE
jgi:tripartite-type tricarboxylate transporter receptor subunit TctC